MIVEDDIETAEMLGHYFEAQDYQVVTALWGEDALKAAWEKTPDLVVLDIRLPDIDGFEVYRRLRSQRRTLSVPIIFLTERGGRADRLTGLKLGAVDYVTKPFDVHELHLRVRNALRRNKLESLVNPVTGLPTDPIIDNQLSVLIQQKSWALLLISVQGLRKFSDQYGFVLGDDVLRTIALMLRNIMKQVGEKEAFIGHLDEADFVLIVSPSRLGELREQIAARLQGIFNYFYPLQDRARQADKHSGISLAMSTVNASDGPFQSSRELKLIVRQRQVSVQVNA